MLITVVPFVGTGPVSMTTATGLSEYCVLAAVGLLASLSAKEILSPRSKWNRNTKCILDIYIYPLLISVTAIVLYKVIEVM